MDGRKIFAGDRLRRARERLGLKQSDAAALIKISTSYYNQLEKDQRPITPRLLAQLSASFQITDTYFVDTEDVHRSSHLREALADPVFRARPILADTIQSLVRVAPEFGDAFLTLFRAYSIQREKHQSDKSDGDGTTAVFLYDEVRDWVQSKLKEPLRSMIL